MLLEHCQAWWWEQFPRESLTGTNHILSEKPIPNLQAELPLMQIHSISSHPAAGDQRDEISTLHLLSPKRKVNIPLSQAEQAQRLQQPKCCPQPFSISVPLLLIHCNNFMFLSRYPVAPKTVSRTQGEAPISAEQ